MMVMTAIALLHSTLESNQAGQELRFYAQCLHIKKEIIILLNVMRLNSIGRKHCFL